jgi:hypothetical protein
MHTTTLKPAGRSMGQMTRDVVSLFKLRIGVLIMITALVGMAVAPGPAPSFVQVLILAVSVLLASASAGGVQPVCRVRERPPHGAHRQACLCHRRTAPPPCLARPDGCAAGRGRGRGLGRAQWRCGAPRVSRRLLLWGGLHPVAEAAHFSQHRHWRSCGEFCRAGGCRRRGSSPGPAALVAGPGAFLVDTSALLESGHRQPR